MRLLRLFILIVILLAAGLIAAGWWAWNNVLAPISVRLINPDDTVTETITVQWPGGSFDVGSLAAKSARTVTFRVNADGNLQLTIGETAHMLDVYLTSLADDHLIVISNGSPTLILESRP